MGNWEDETYRLQQEVQQSIINAGGTPEVFNIEEIAKFLYGCQCNNITIFRMWPDGKPGKLHVTYNPPLKIEEKEINIKDSYE